LEKAIDDAVVIANAPVLNVEFDTGNHGSFQQRPTTAKKGVPFTVNFDSYVGYYFQEWRVYKDSVSDANLFSKEKGEVSISAPNDRQSNITINVNHSGKIIVLAYTENSPSLLFADADVMRISGSAGGAGNDGKIYPNTYARFSFSKPMDPDSFVYGDTVKICQIPTAPFDLN
jgi:hypothetical protein